MAERQTSCNVRAEDDRLFPGGAALRIGQVVDLVEDDGVDIVEIPGGLQQHVAQDLGGHHHDSGVPVLGHIAGQQTDLIAIDLAQIAEFLVGERLDRRGVDHPAGAPEGGIDANSATTVFPVPVGAATMTDTPSTSAAIDSCWKESSGKG